MHRLLKMDKNNFVLTQCSIAQNSFSGWQTSYREGNGNSLKSHGRKSLVGYSPWGREELDTTERLHFHFHALEKEMATHSSILAWRIPETAEPGGLSSMGSHRVVHD